MTREMTAEEREVFEGLKDHLEIRQAALNGGRPTAIREIRFVLQAMASVQALPRLVDERSPEFVLASHLRDYHCPKVKVA